MQFKNQPSAWFCLGLALALGLVAGRCSLVASSSSPPELHHEAQNQNPNLNPNQQQQQLESCATADEPSGLCAGQLKRKQNETKATEALAAWKREQQGDGAQPPQDSEQLQSNTYVTTRDKLRNSDSHAWRYEYFDEQAKGFDVRVLDESFDERLANVIYTIISTKVVSVDFFNFNSGDPQEDAANMNSTAGPQVDEAECGRHLGEMLELLDEIGGRLAERRANSSASLQFEEKHLRLARALDSYGRYESGHLSGKTHTMGQYDQCANTQLLLRSRGPGDGRPLDKVQARYCWARLNIDRHLSENLRQRVKSEYEATMTNLMMGVCLPASCHSKTFAANRRLIQRLVDTQFRLPKSLYVDETLDVDFVYCPVDKDSEYATLSASGKLALLFVAGWFLLTVYATYAPPAATSKSSPTLACVLDCLSLRKSWLDFVGEPDEETPREELEKAELARRQRTIELDTLNPVKVFGCVFVVIGHSLILQSAVTQDGLKAYKTIEEDPAVLAMVVGTVVVDTFFVITGILMGYVVMRRSQRQPHDRSHQANGPSTSGASQANGSGAAARATGARPSGGRPVAAFFKQWLKFAVGRHLRLVPLFFLVFWLKKSVFISYFAERPLWDAGFNKDTEYGACKRESWTTPLTMMSAFLPLSKQCLPQAWSVSTDLFFSLTVSPIMLMMPRHPRAAFAVSVALILASNIWALKAYKAVDPEMSDALNDLHAHGFAFMFGSIHHLYTYPHYRFCSILIGLVAGYYLYHHGLAEQQAAATGKGRGPRQWPGWFGGIATNWALATIAAIFFGFSYTPHLKYYVAPYHKLVFTNMFTSGRIVWALCNAILFMRMASDWRHGFFMRMFAGRFWQCLVRLNLAILLVHMDMLMYLMASSTSFNYFTKQNILTSFSSAYFYCIPLAALLHVVYENPMDKLVRRHLMPRLFAAA